MVLKMDQRCAYAAKPFVPDLISQPWIGLSSKALDRLWFRREDKNRVESHHSLRNRGQEKVEQNEHEKVLLREAISSYYQRVTLLPMV
jgi:transcription initiation factor TFIID subunit TAF12